MMKNTRIVSLLLLLAMLFSLTVATLVSCNEPEDPTPDGPGDQEEQPGDKPGATKINYEVTVTSYGGMPMKGLTIYTYEGDDLKAYGTTDENGIAKIEMEQGTYTAKITGAPAGYIVEDSYSFGSSTKLSVKLASSVIKGDHSFEGKNYKLGDVMHDFTVTLPDGVTEITLSDLLREKDAVLINFWYTQCSPCINEFPHLDAVAQDYLDSIAVLALNTNPQESILDVENFKNQYQLSLDMTKADNSLFSAFSNLTLSLYGNTGYPTSVMIDRYGVICLVELGGLTSEKPFRVMFDHFSGPDYQQKLIKDLNELMPTEIPNITDVPTSDEIGDVINSGNIDISYYFSDETYSWPFVIGEKNGKPCIKTPIAFKDNAYATLHADVVLEAGDALAFDFFSSTESGADYLYILINEDVICTLAGISEDWETQFAFVAETTGTYKLTLLYAKDGDTDVGDDTFYITNMRVTDADSVNKATYIPRFCATDPFENGDGFETYVNVVYNEADGYYHVCVDHAEGHTCDKNGPLLLADLMGQTRFSKDDSIYTYIYKSYNYGIYLGGVPDAVTPIYEGAVKYCSYASNSELYGLCPVTEELAGYLKAVATTYKIGNKTDNDWLQFCKYYSAYGTEGKQLSDPIVGLAPFSAYDTVVNTEEGLDEYPNIVTYNKVIMPRGLWYEFVPEKSGIYRISSAPVDIKGNKNEYVEGWIFGADGTELLYYVFGERYATDYSINAVEIVMYFEAGTPYYVDIAYNDPYYFNSFGFKIEPVTDEDGKIATEYESFYSASPGSAFTYALDENGELTDSIIYEGIKIALCNKEACEDCAHEAKIMGAAAGTKYYHHLREDGTQGSLIYLDMTIGTPVFGERPIYSVPGSPFTSLIDLGAFDFTKDEEGNDANGEDMTEFISAYIEKIIDDTSCHDEGCTYGRCSDTVRYGCIPVDAELAEVLQMLMDKYTFKVNNSWAKLCYYYKKIDKDNVN